MQIISYPSAAHSILAKVTTNHRLSTKQKDRSSANEGWGGGGGGGGGVQVAEFPEGGLVSRWLVGRRAVSAQVAHGPVSLSDTLPLRPLSPVSLRSGRKVKDRNKRVACLDLPQTIPLTDHGADI